MSRYKKLTLLHSNDMHGDFMAEKVDERLMGGVSMLAGYVDRVRNTQPNTLYCIAGDMLRGSVIDSEYKGFSTIEIMNALAPDVATVGNHEIDYGIAHLLFLEKCAQFPIINANLYIKSNHTRLFQPYTILTVDGMKILFIGILTEEVLSQARKEAVIGSFVDVHEAAHEVGKICNAYRTEDVDLTVLLTHIGFEEDKRLAALLDPLWGVDLIIGGHSHTLPKEPAMVNGITIVQAGTGTDQIGRFDLVVDTWENRVAECTWQIVPIQAETCPRDPDMEKILQPYQTETDKKYNRLLTRLRRQVTHPDRYRETDMGNLVADSLQESLGLDVMLMGSGGLRIPAMGPVVLYKDLMECLPYDDPIYMVTVTGAQFKQMMRYVLRDEMWQGEHGEFYQISQGLRIVYDRQKKEFLEFSFGGEPITEDQTLRVGVEKYHFVNFEKHFQVPLAEVEANRKPTVVTTSTRDVVEEYLTSHTHLERKVDGRLTVL